MPAIDTGTYTRAEVAELCYKELVKHGLKDWSVRFNQNELSGWVGLCLHKDRTIVFNVHHVDTHPRVELDNTIKHEVAHAIVGPGHGHDFVWRQKAKEIGCDNTSPCMNYGLSPEAIDAIRSGATLEVTVEETVIRTPKYKITRIQDKCEVCGKVARSVSEQTILSESEHIIDLKIIKLECGHIITKKLPKATPFHLLQWGGDENCKHTWEKNKCTSCGRFRPYQFQIEGMRRCEAALAINSGFGFFDEMGLGKTIQAIGIVRFHPEYANPTLWVVKSGLKFQFASQLLTILGDEHVPQIVETSKDWLIPGLKHYIIGYDMLVPKTKKMKKSEKIVHIEFDIKQFERVGIKLVVLDECQQIKNVDSTRTQIVRQVVKGRKVIPLSGTPWKNRGSELFPVYNMMDPMRFDSEKGFKDNWVHKYWDGKYMREGGIKNVVQFREHVKDLCIRRERTEPEVKDELPLVNRTKLYITMNLEEEKVYDEAVEEFMKWYEAQKADISAMHILAAMQKMRHLVALAKIPATMEYVDEFVEDTDRKLVIFAHHKDVQFILHEECKKIYEKDAKAEDRIPVYKITSEMNGEERHRVQTAFNAAKRAILVASTLAAGEGLNLQTCADCIMHERQWNPANEEQAEGRFIRIGQEAETVNAVYAHCEGLTTIDPHLDRIVERKRLQFHAAMNNGEAPVWSSDMIAKDLAESIIRAYKHKKAA